MDKDTAQIPRAQKPMTDAQLLLNLNLASDAIETLGKFVVMLIESVQSRIIAKNPEGLERLRQVVEDARRYPEGADIIMDAARDAGDPKEQDPERWDGMA